MLLVLAVMWGGFLIWWFRSHGQQAFGDSVGTFRRHLNVLEKTAPVTVPPANRLRGPYTVPAYRPPPGAPTIPGAPSSVRRAAAGRPQMTPADARRRRTLKRRRDVLFVLTVAVVATLIMAVATRSHSLVLLQLVADATLVGYIALLVRLRNLAAERDLKLTYLPRSRSRAASPQPSAGGGEAYAYAYATTGSYPAVVGDPYGMAPGAARSHGAARRRPAGYGAQAARRAVR